MNNKKINNINIRGLQIKVMHLKRLLQCGYTTIPCRLAIDHIKNLKKGFFKKLLKIKTGFQKMVNNYYIKGHSPITKYGRCKLNRTAAQI